MILFVITTSLLLAVQGLTPCEQKREKASKNNLGAYVPQCKNDGSYKETQCWASTGYCWCVDEDGVELQNTRRRGSPLDCAALRSMTSCQLLVATSKPMPGVYIPQCREDGSWKEVQCRGSTGYCWCVDRDGNEVDGTKQRGPPDCESNQSKCEAERYESSKRGPIPGKFIVQCQDDGRYSPVQCWASTGYCWCVSEDGKRIPDTETRGRPNC